MKQTITAIALFFISVYSFSQNSADHSKWLTQPVTIDGEAKDWSQPLNFYDDKTKLMFAIANDSNKLYLCFQSNDVLNQMKINRAGMKIVLSTKGKNKHHASIEFPMAQIGEPSTEKKPKCRCKTKT